MAGISSLTSVLFVGRPQAAATSLFAAARAQQGSPPTATARTQQARAAQVVDARQLAVTKGLQSLETALSRMAFETSDLAGDREEIREDRTRFASRDVYRTEDIVSREPVYATRALFEIRELKTPRALMAERPVFETRNVIETRDVIETQPIYEQQEIRETIVIGNRDLTDFDRFSDAGISNGREFSVRVGTDATATIRFSSSSRIRLTVGGNSTNFDFVSNDGSWRTALLDALNSIDNLSASIDGDGQLVLQTASAQNLRLRDESGTPLDNLGLSEGTTASSVTGYAQVQVGTEDVVVGTEDVVVGTEEVQVGTETFVARIKDEVVGEEVVVTGSETYVADVRDVVTGTRDIFERTELVDTGVIENVLVGFSRPEAPPAQSTNSEGRRAVLEAVLTLDGAIGRETADNPFAGLRDSIGLDSLLGLASGDERDAALTKIRAALDTFRDAAPAASMTTLIQAGITLEQGTTGNPLAYAAAKAKAPAFGILV